MHNNNFFNINKVGERIYIINLNWTCYNCIINKEDGFKFNLKFKFYQKHDYPVPLYHKIVKITLKMYYGVPILLEKMEFLKTNQKPFFKNYTQAYILFFTIIH